MPRLNSRTKAQRLRRQVEKVKSDDKLNPERKREREKRSRVETSGFKEPPTKLRKRLDGTGISTNLIKAKLLRSRGDDCTSKDSLRYGSFHYDGRS